MEALPRALLYLHDRVGEGGLSTNKILMGRERPIAGIPYNPERECIEAQDYFDQISEIDQLVADNLDGEHIMHNIDTTRASKVAPNIGWATWFG